MGVGIEVLAGNCLCIAIILHLSRLYIYLEWLCRGLLDTVETLKTSNPWCISLMSAQACVVALLYGSTAPFISFIVAVSSVTIIIVLYFYYVYFIIMFIIIIIITL